MVKEMILILNCIMDNFPILDGNVHRPQTTLRHHEAETQNTDRHTTAKTILKQGSQLG